MSSTIREALEVLAASITPWSPGRLDQSGQDAAAADLMVLLTASSHKHAARWLAEFTSTETYYRQARTDGYIDWSLPTHSVLSEVKADDDPRPRHGEKTVWCTTCDRRRTVVDTDTDVARERTGEREFWIEMLNCGHSRSGPTGKFTGYTVDATGMPYL